VNKDEALILEAEQWSNKSTVLEALAVNPDGYCHGLRLDSGAQEAVEEVQGRRIVELAELTARTAGPTSTSRFSAPSSGARTASATRCCATSTSWGAEAALQQAEGRIAHLSTRASGTTRAHSKPSGTSPTIRGSLTDSWTSHCPVGQRDSKTRSYEIALTGC
jgi:hypothetical protein